MYARNNLTRTFRYLLTGVFLFALCHSMTSAETSLHSLFPQQAYPAKHEKPGLLIIAHGSPGKTWNAPVLELFERVKKLNNSQHVFHSVEVAFLEFAKPDVPSGVEALEAAGCDRIIAVPVFIAPSSHTHFDVPAVLGLYTSPDIRATLKSENARVASPNVPVTLAQTLDGGSVLEDFVVSEVKKLSKDPKNEAIVVMAHGCPDHEKLVDNVMQRVTSAACGATGISFSEHAYCAVGQTYIEEGVMVLSHATEARKRVLVVGLYLGLSADKLHKTGMKFAPDFMTASIREMLDGKDIVFSTNSVVEFSETAQWVLDTGRESMSAL